MKIDEKFDEAFESFINGSQSICDDYEKEQGSKAFGKTLTYIKGRRYIKIIATPKLGSGQSVWAFIDMTNGDVLKPASWKAPAKGMRGNIYDDKNGLGRITAYGPEYNK